MVGFEALLRWTNPELGVVSPAEFVQIAERTGLIIPIGAWVLEQACRQMEAWAARLGRETFTAHQASARGGDLVCRLEGERVWLGGPCVTVVEGWFYV